MIWSSMVTLQMLKQAKKWWEHQSDIESQKKTTERIRWEHRPQDRQHQAVADDQRNWWQRMRMSDQKWTVSKGWMFLAWSSKYLFKLYATTLVCSFADLTKTKLLHLIADSRDGRKIHTGCLKGVTIIPKVCTLNAMLLFVIIIFTKVYMNQNLFFFQIFLLFPECSILISFQEVVLFHISQLNSCYLLFTLWAS